MDSDGVINNKNNSQIYKKREESAQAALPMPYPPTQRVSRSALQSTPSVSDGKEHHLKNKKSAVYSVLEVQFLWVISMTGNVLALDSECTFCLKTANKQNQGFLRATIST